MGRRGLGLESGLFSVEEKSSKLSIGVAGGVHPSPNGRGGEKSTSRSKNPGIIEGERDEFDGTVVIFDNFFFFISIFLNFFFFFFGIFILFLGNLGRRILNFVEKTDWRN